jgi:hypothetical protein
VGGVWLVAVAVRTEWGWGFLDTVEVLVEGDMARAGLDEQGGIVP